MIHACKRHHVAEFILLRNSQDLPDLLCFRPARFTAAKLVQDFAPCPNFDGALIRAASGLDHPPIRADDRSVRYILLEIPRETGCPNELVPVLRKMIRGDARCFFASDFL